MSTEHQELFDLLYEYQFGNVLEYIRLYPLILRIRIPSIKEKFQLFESFGFSKEDISNIFWDTPYLFRIKTFYLDLNLRFLTQVFGKNEAIDSILNSPSVLLFSPQKINERVNLLNKYGFSNPIKFIDDYPDILYMNLKKIEHRINYVLLFGFKNPIMIFEKNPKIFEIRIEDFLVFMEELKKTYKNYLEVFEKDPWILGYDDEEGENK